MSAVPAAVAMVKKIQMRWVATLLGFDPEAPETWPIADIDHLLKIKRRHGKREFDAAIWKMLRNYRQ